MRDRMAERGKKALRQLNIDVSAIKYRAIEQMAANAGMSRKDFLSWLVDQQIDRLLNEAKPVRTK